MLTPQEALLFQAVKDEEAAQMSQNAALGLGAAGGGLLGLGAGNISHQLGNAINSLKDKAAATQGLTPAKSMRTRLKPGGRMAGGLTGLILGGGLGAGMAALMKQESPSARVLGKIQAQNGELDEQDKVELSRLLGDVYNNPSELM